MCVRMCVFIKIQSRNPTPINAEDASLSFFLIEKDLFCLLAAENDSEDLSVYFEFKDHYFNF